MEKGPMNKTRLAGDSELSYDKFLIYLDWMCKKKLIEEENGSVQVMDEGIRTYNLLVDWILKHVGKLWLRRWPEAFLSKICPAEIPHDQSDNFYTAIIVLWQL